MKAAAIVFVAAAVFLSTVQLGGIRFGVAVALLTIVPTYLIYYVVQPMPGATVAKQIVFDGVLTLLLASVTAFIYRQPAQS